MKENDYSAVQPLQQRPRRRTTRPTRSRLTIATNSLKSGKREGHEGPKESPILEEEVCGPTVRQTARRPPKASDDHVRPDKQTAMANQLNMLRIDVSRKVLCHYSFSFILDKVEGKTVMTQDLSGDVVEESTPGRLNSSPSLFRFFVWSHVVIAGLVAYIGGLCLHGWTTDLFFENWGLFLGLHGLLSATLQRIGRYRSLLLVGRVVLRLGRCCNHCWHVVILLR